MLNVSSLSRSFYSGVILVTALSLPLRAVIREVPAGASALPAAVEKTKKSAEEIAAAFTKDKEAALALPLFAEGKPFRITGKVKDFTADHPLNHDQDLFIILTEPAAASETPTTSTAPTTPPERPYRIHVRFSRPQMEAFGFPADKKPPLDGRYVGLTRKVNQSHTVAYFNKDLNCVALFDSEDLIPPAPAAASKAPKPSPIPFSADKIPLVSIGDTFEADVVFEQLDAENDLVFSATIDPGQPAPKATAAAPTVKK